MHYPIFHCLYLRISLNIHIFRISPQHSMVSCRHALQQILLKVSGEMPTFLAVPRSNPQYLAEMSCKTHRYMLCINLHDTISICVFYTNNLICICLFDVFSSTGSPCICICSHIQWTLFWLIHQDTSATRVVLWFLFSCSIDKWLCSMGNAAGTGLLICRFHDNIEQ